jgi:hypothetical protein
MTSEIARSMGRRMDQRMAAELGVKLEGYSDATRLRHSRQRLLELQQQLGDLLSSLAQLDRVPLDGVPMAVEYPRPTTSRLPPVTG